VDELIATLDDDCDPVHAHYSPSINALIDLGHPAIPRVLDLMLSPDELTRIRAQYILEQITGRDFGCRNGIWWSHEDYSRWEAFWKSLGNLQWYAPEDDRRRSIQMWRDWLANRRKA
jgi:hypothetical protein